MRGVRGVSTPGGWTWVEGEKSRFAALLAALAPGPWEIVVRRPQTKRSVDQNALMWKQEAVLAESLGWDKHEKDALHDAILRVAYGEKEIVDPFTGVARTVPARRTREMSTREMSEHIDWFVRWCITEHECRVPLPEDEEVAT